MCAHTRKIEPQQRWGINNSLRHAAIAIFVMSGSVGATKKNHVTAGTLMQAHARSGGRQGMTSAQTSNAGTPNAKLAHCRMRHPCSARNQQTNQSNRCGLTQSEILVVAFSMTADGLLLRARLSATNQKYKLSVGVRKTIMAGSAVTKPKLTRPDAEHFKLPTHNEASTAMQRAANSC